MLIIPKRMKPSNTRQLAILLRCQPSYSEWRLARSKSQAQMNQKQPQQGQKRILVVDDEPDLTMIYSLALQYHGFKVDTFNDVQEALSNFKPGYYDLVILDIKMPKMDGFELYNKIKKETRQSEDLLPYRE